MSKLAEKLRTGQFIVTTELTPPKGIDLTELFAKADALKGSVDAINLTDSPRARMTVDPKAVGHLLLDRGVEPIIQITARDRNRIAIQSDVLGGVLLGLHNYVFMGGDQPGAGDHPEAKAVFDWTASDMLRAAVALRGGKDAGGSVIKGDPHLCVGATANPGAKDFAAEVANTKRKIAAGAQFLQTQALYDVAVLKRFLEAIEPVGVGILAGIIPLKSAKMARWLNDNVPGIEVPDAIIHRIEKSAKGESDVTPGLEIAAETMRAVQSICGGVHVMAIGLEQYIPDLLAQSGIRR